MIISDELAAGWYYLSTLNDDVTRAEVFHDLEQRLKYIPGDCQQWFSWYLDHYRNYETFPTWQQFKEAIQMENEPAIDTKRAQLIYDKNMATWESDWISDKMKSVPLLERRRLLERQVQILQPHITQEEQLTSDGDFALEGNFIIAEEQEQSKFKFPVKYLNDRSVIKPGNVVSVLAGPGQGKTAFALNTSYINSVKSTLVGLYIYLENLPSAYMAELYARYSYDNGAKIENAALKRGVLADDVNGANAIKKLKEDYDKEKKGKIYFKPFSKYPSDPLAFGTALAHDINTYNVDYIVFDYVQKAKAFAPLRIDGTTYLNQLVSTISACALGGFNANPFVAMLLIQPNREAQQKADRTRGSSLNLTSIAEINQVERDSFFAIALWSDAESKEANQEGVKVIKARDGSSDIAPQQTLWIPQYCLMGDMGTGDDNQQIYSNEMLDQVFDDLDI